MKRLICCLTLLCLMAGLIACGSQTADFDGSKTLQLDAANSNGSTVQIVDADAIARFYQLLNEAEAKACDDTVSDKEAFRLTAYDAESQAIHTLSIFNDSYVLMNDTLYKGDFDSLLKELPKYFAIDTLNDLSSLFGAKDKEITEIALYNRKLNTFKTVTTLVEIRKVTGALKQVALQKVESIPEADPSYYLYYRLMDKDEYEPVITVIPAHENMILSSCGKRCVTTACDFAALYNSLDANTMPIPSSFLK